MLSFHLVAPKKPSIRNFPQTVIASEGISITLKCKTKGSPRPKITWYKDDELIGICEGGNSRKCQSFTRMNTEFKKNSITLLQLSSKRNSGKYTCEVENFMGKFSSSARMIVFSKYACMYYIHALWVMHLIQYVDAHRLEFVRSGMVLKFPILHVFIIFRCLLRTRSNCCKWSAAFSVNVIFFRCRQTCFSQAFWYKLL